MGKRIVISYSEEFDLDEYWASREEYGFTTEEQVIANMKADILDDVYSGRPYITADNLTVEIVDDGEGSPVSAKVKDIFDRFESRKIVAEQALAELEHVLSADYCDHSSVIVANLYGETTCLQCGEGNV